MTIRACLTALATMLYTFSPAGVEMSMSSARSALPPPSTSPHCACRFCFRASIAGPRSEERTIRGDKGHLMLMDTHRFTIRGD